MLTQLIAMFPIMSLLRSEEPFCLLALPLLVGILETFILLQLAWHSIGVRVPTKRSLLPAAIQGVLVFLIRQSMPVLLHILPVVVVFAVVVWWVSRTSVVRAFMAALFAEAVAVLGSIVLVEPLVRYSWAYFFRTFLGYSLGMLLEAIPPAIVLLVFIRWKLSLVRRKGEEVGHLESQ